MTPTTEILLRYLDKEEEEGIYGRSEQIRNAALYYMMDVDPELTTAEFVTAMAERGISYNTAKCRLNETRRLSKGDPEFANCSWAK